MRRIMSASSLVLQARRKSGLTQSALAERMGLPQSVVARLERPGSNPTWETVSRALAAAGHELRLHRLGAGAGEGLDLQQLKVRLELSPVERLRLFQDSHENLSRLVANARRHDAD
jgi:transcriptional regulator with XRE-family HTH domain